MGGENPGDVIVKVIWAAPVCIVIPTVAAIKPLHEIAHHLVDNALVVGCAECFACRMIKHPEQRPVVAPARWALSNLIQKTDQMTALGLAHPRPNALTGLPYHKSDLRRFDSALIPIGAWYRGMSPRPQYIGIAAVDQRAISQL